MTTTLVVKINADQMCNLLRRTPVAVKRALKVLAIQNGGMSMSDYVSMILVDHLKAKGYEFMTIDDPKEEDAKR